MTTRLGVVALVLGVVFAGTGGAHAATESFLRPPHFYLSLGDSLSQGVQPDAEGHSVETDQGYADGLFQMERSSFPRLHLVKMGCPGESTETMMHGGICSYAQGSQLAQAVHFLRHHRKNTVFVTLDIGANNVDGCLHDGQVDQQCISDGLDAVQADVPVIVAALNAALGSHGTSQMVGMRYYDPYLAFYLDGPDGQALAALSLQLTNLFNFILQSAYQALGWKVANVSFAFQTNDTTDTVDYPPYGTIPVNVANICTYTWMCADPPVGPNIHANAAGYQLIAQVFAGQITGP